MASRHSAAVSLNTICTVILYYSGKYYSTEEPERRSRKEPKLLARAGAVFKVSAPAPGLTQESHTLSFIYHESSTLINIHY